MVALTRSRFSMDRLPSMRSSSERVPQTLQTVFVVAGRGKEVNKPPPGKVANRSFSRFFRRTRGNNSVNDLTQLTQEFEDNSSGEFEIPKVICTSTKALECQSSHSSSLSNSITKHHVSPQAYLTSLLKTRGYNDSTFKCLQTAYYNKPTALQVASHGTKVIEAIRTDNVQLFRELMDVGLSPNACNEHGESILHMVCRTGKKVLLEILLDYGCTVQVCDDYGRTPLHDACWAAEPNFEIVDMILERDAKLLSMEDSRGALPLTYLREEQWTVWTKYLMSRKDKFWPDRDILKNGVEPNPPLTLESPNTRPVPCPKDALPLELARMVAQGRMHPMEAAILKDDDNDATSECSSSDCDSDCSDDDEEDSESEDVSSHCEDDECEHEDTNGDEDDDSDDWSVSTFGEQEMEEILGCLGRGQAIAWSA